ncbi:hypothetical protein ACHAPT_005236 [Fusarium lateritium]
MLKFIENTSNKAEWWLEVRKPEAALDWKQRTLEMFSYEYRPHTDFTEAVAVVDPRFEELVNKSKFFEETGLALVMDYAVYVTKSDVLLTHDLKEALRTAIRPLEGFPGSQKDWHPGIDVRFLSLLDSSLWPME